MSLGMHQILFSRLIVNDLSRVDYANPTPISIFCSMDTPAFTVLVAAYIQIVSIIT